jgi:hypothetical protein
MTQTLKNIFALALLAGVAILGYFMFIQKDATSLFVTEDSVIANDLLVQASSFIEKRQKIDSLSLDIQILTNEKFSSLTTYTKPVSDQPVGKETLFEPAQEFLPEQ